MNRQMRAFSVKSEGFVLQRQVSDPYRTALHFNGVRAFALVQQEGQPQFLALVAGHPQFGIAQADRMAFGAYAHFHDIVAIVQESQVLFRAGADMDAPQFMPPRPNCGFEAAAFGAWSSAYAAGAKMQAIKQNPDKTSFIFRLSYRDEKQ